MQLNFCQLRHVIYANYHCRRRLWASEYEIPLTAVLWGCWMGVVIQSTVPSRWSHRVPMARVRWPYYGSIYPMRFMACSPSHLRQWLQQPRWGADRRTRRRSPSLKLPKKAMHMLCTAPFMEEGCLHGSNEHLKTMAWSSGCCTYHVSIEDIWEYLGMGAGCPHVGQGYG